MPTPWWVHIHECRPKCLGLYECIRSSVGPKAGSWYSFFISWWILISSIGYVSTTIALKMLDMIIYMYISTCKSLCNIYLMNMEMRSILCHLTINCQYIFTTVLLWVTSILTKIWFITMIQSLCSFLEVSESQKYRWQSNMQETITWNCHRKYIDRIWLNS